MGVNRPYVAKKVKEAFEEGDAKTKLTASRMYLALTGDIKDERSGAGNVFNAPVMVIVGASQERLKALRGAVPQLSKEQQEAIDDARTQERLEAFKRGEIPLVSRHSEARIKDEQETILDVESRDVECAPEAQPDAG
jgi:hypothetical protein